MKDGKLFIRIIVSIIGLIAAPSVALFLYDRYPNGSLANFLFISYFSIFVLGILAVKFLKAEREFKMPKLSREHAERQGNFNENQNTKLSLVVVLTIVAFLILLSVLGIPVESILKIISAFPFISFVFSVLLFVFVCLANWNKRLRKKVNYYLSGGEEDDQIAYAKSEELLYTLNALLVFIAGIIGILALLYLGL